MEVRLHGDRPNRPVALVCGIFFPDVYLELALIKALELAGFEPIILMNHSGAPVPLAKYYRLAGLDKAFRWQDFADAPQTDVAARAVSVTLHAFVAASIGQARGAARILDRFEPDLVLLYDKA